MVSIQNDLSLLEELLGDSKGANTLFNAGPYWQIYSQRTAQAIKHEGLENFRDNTAIVKGYGDNFTTNPFDVMPRNSKGYLLHALMEKTPFVDKVLETYQKHIRALRDQLIRANGEWLVAKYADVLKKYQDVLAGMDTTIGKPCQTLDYNGHALAFSYINQLHRLDLFLNQNVFKKAKVLVEIGGGIGINAHLVNAICPEIEKIIYIDISPVLYVGTQHLKAATGDVYDYARYKKEQPKSLDQIKEKIICLPPWCLDALDFKWDVCWNSNSFQEMTEAQIQYYLGALEERAAPDAAYALIYYKGNNDSISFDRFKDFCSLPLNVFNEEDYYFYATAKAGDVSVSPKPSTAPKQEPSRERLAG